MNRLTACLVFIFSTNYFANAQHVRFDYDYFKDIDGWLKYHEHPRPWRKALLKCYSEGAMLASPLNAAFRTNMFSLMPNNLTARGTYTGINTAFFSKGNFHSIEGIQLKDIPHEWNNESHDDEGCVVMDADGHFTVNNCNEPLQYTCYINNTQIKTNSLCATNDKEYTFSNFSGHCYKFHEEQRSWSEAYKICVSEGGYLAVIRDGEADILKDLFALHPNASFGYSRIDVALVGFRNWYERGEWLTVHGETLREAGYEGWGYGQPDVAPNFPQQCGAIFRTAKLDNFQCEYRAPFICKIESPN